ncbi:glycosyltransferase family 39 protein [Geminicoccus harenae]|uniref:glycosyltransferase family 39 protein n=1 Tax=Geminicoccus harenae TaxID=2498453 RepID=UPI00168A7909|nr:glycosyltransferase family 39 protein [Geminicoccus harenae]
MQHALTRSPPSGSMAARLAEPRVVLGILALWLLLHAVLRLLTGPTLGMDDAEQALSAQAWSWGYRTEQPPLFTWLLLLLEPVLGVGHVPITVLRYLFLGGCCLAYWQAARLWLGDDGRAAVAVLALPAMYTFGWYAQVDLTHSTVLATAVAVLLWLSARLARRQTYLDYFLLGVTLGLGVLGKWNFALAGLALVLTGLILPELRRVVLHPGTLLAAAVALVIVLPNAWWLLGHKSMGEAGTAVLVRGARSQLASLGDLLVAALAFAQPWLVLAGILFLPSLRRCRREQVARPAVRVLGTYVIIALLLHALLVVPFGGVNYSERWMIGPLLPLPILFAAFLAPQHLPIGRWLAVLAVLVVVTLGMRVAIPLAGGDACLGKCRILYPFDAIADGLRQAGFRDGTVVVGDLHLGGNLRVRMPQSRVVETSAPPGVFGPPTGNGQCLLAWISPEPGTPPPPELLEGARAKLGVDASLPARRGAVTAPLLGAVERRLSIGYLLFEQPNGECR